MKDLKDFLEKVRKFSPKIGEHAMRHTAAKLNLSPLLGSAAYEGQSEALETEEDLSAEDWVDFSAVYRCLHIRTVLGEREEFEKYYRKQRRQQVRFYLATRTKVISDIPIPYFTTRLTLQIDRLPGKELSYANFLFLKLSGREALTCGS